MSRRARQRQEAMDAKYLAFAPIADPNEPDCDDDPQLHHYYPATEHDVTPTPRTEHGQHQ